MKHSACPICNKEAGHRTYALREMMFGTRDVFHYALCENCGCLTIADPPQDIGRYYPPNYYSLSPPAKWACPSWLKVLGWRRLALDYLRRRQTWSARLIRKLATALPKDVVCVLDYLRRAGIRDCDSAILDVGCGSFPQRLHALKACGFRDLLGVDPYISADTERCGVKVLKGELDAVSGRYDLIMFHHSFEHLSDPHQALERAASLLKAGGVLLIRTPVMGSYMWEKYGTDWVELDAPRHSVIYSRAAMNLLAEMHGLELYEVVPDSGAWELIASEQYKLDIPLRSPQSHLSAPEHSVFSPEDLQRFSREVEQMNQTNRAGRAGYYFRRRGSRHHA